MDKVFSITKEQAKNSVECRWRKFQLKCNLILAIVFSVFFVALCLLLHFLSTDFDTFILIEIYGLFPLLICLFFGIAIYNYSCYKRVVKVAELCPVYRVKLDQVNTCWYRKGKVYYSVRIDLEKGAIYRDTSRMFSTMFFDISPISMGYYNNKEVYVLHDTGDDRIYVIDLVDVVQVKSKV